MSGTHPNEKLASEEAIPRVFGVMVRIDQHRPLITTNNQFPTGKLHMHTKSTMSIKKSVLDKPTLHSSNLNQWGREGHW